MTWFALTHGLTSLFAATSLTALMTLVGLIHGRAKPARYLWLIPLAPLATALGIPLAAAVRHSLALLTHQPSASLAALVMSLLTFAFLGYLGGRALAGRQRNDIHKRGTVVTDVTGAQRRALRRKRRDPTRLTLTGIDVPPLDETKHFKLIGTTGTGKSTAIRELLQTIRARGERAVIADPDGGYSQAFHDPEQGDVILNPFDERSRKWDLYAELRQPYDYEQLARSIVGEGEGGERSWRLYAQQFLAALLRQTHELKLRDTAELVRLLTAASTEELGILLDGTAAKPFLEGGNERMLGSIRSVTSAATAALDFIAEQKSEAFSIRHWVRAGNGCLYLPYMADQIASLRSLISTWMRIAIFETMTSTANHSANSAQPLWFIVDELDALGKIDGLKDALARLRKFNGRCVLGFQSIAQVSNTYGDGEAQTIVENCGNTLILRCSASEQGGTAKFASRLIGQREVIRQQTSTSRSRQGFAERTQRSRTTSQQHVTEDAVMASEIEQLPDLSGYLKLASSPSWLRVRMST
jgi:type IV secretory pathway TraG/TraD family ATPase VirD4